MTLATICSSLFLFPPYTYIIQCASNSTCSETLSHIPLQEIMGVITEKNRKIGTASTTQLKLFHIIKANNDRHEVLHCQSPISSFSECMAYSFGKT